jgi:hypothetical protein
MREAGSCAEIEEADLIVSLGGIDGADDPDLFLTTLARSARKFLFVTSATGYFADMRMHRYHHRDGFGHVDVSPRQTQRILHALGFPAVAIFPRLLGSNNALGTVVVACRDRIPAASLIDPDVIAMQFAPYRVAPSTMSKNSIVQAVNCACSYLSDPQFALANSAQYFRQCVRELRRLPQRQFGTVHQLAVDPANTNSAVRVDIDADLVAAAVMARIAGEEGMPISFYILHTAGYYGNWERGCFRRNEAAGDIYREIQAEGAEVGMHIDPYHLYLDRAIDGGAAVVTELAWLRGCGLDIRGYSAHNCASVYGVENFEIFAERRIAQEPYIVNDHRYAPLAVLTETSLGLEYEAAAATAAPGATTDHPFLSTRPSGDFIRDYRWLRTYLHDNPYCRWGHDFHIWVIGQDRWAISGSSSAIFEFDVNWQTVYDTVAGLPSTARILITLHPCYFGYRSSAGAGPSLG